MLRALPLREGQACCALSCGPHLVCSAHEGVADDHVEQRGGAEAAGGGFLDGRPTSTPRKTRRRLDGRAQVAVLHTPRSGCCRLSLQLLHARSELTILGLELEHSGRIRGDGGNCQRQKGEDAHLNNFRLSNQPVPKSRQPVVAVVGFNEKSRRRLAVTAPVMKKEKVPQNL